MPFEHPLWIVYSSGTTGLPKPIVHGHGGTVIVALALGFMALLLLTVVRGDLMDGHVAGLPSLRVAVR